ncbi:MAG: glutathione S-transferase family protein [Candidatus Thermoplasmatota archaeon]
MANPVLVRLPFSHFCRKAEWGLSQAGIAYSTLDVGLFGLRRLRRINPEGTVPILVDGDALIVGAGRILLWADAHKAPNAPALYPIEATSDVAAWETWADTTIGPVARREAYRALLANPRLARGHGLPWWSRTPAARRIYLGVLKTLKARRFDDADAKAVPIILEKVSRRLASSPFLFGTKPTAADIATAALLEPLVVSAPQRGYAQILGWSAVEAFVTRVRPARTTSTGGRRMTSAALHRLADLAARQPPAATAALRCECGAPDARTIATQAELAGLSMPA